MVARSVRWLGDVAATWPASSLQLRAAGSSSTGSSSAGAGTAVGGIDGSAGVESSDGSTRSIGRAAVGRFSGIGAAPTAPSLGTNS
jgi:hypothetical protein